MLQFNVSLVYNIINLIVLCLLLKHFLIKPVLGIMDKRQAMINEKLENVKSTKEEADALKSQYEAALKDARAESGRIVEEAKAMQNGQGKSIKYAFSHPTGKIEVLGFGEDGRMLFKYHEAKDPARCGRIFSLELAPGQCWLD